MLLSDRGRGDSEANTIRPAVVAIFNLSRRFDVPENLASCR